MSSDMDKEFLKFILGETNYYKGEVSISRDPLKGKGSDFYYLEQEGKVALSFWGAVEKGKGKKLKESPLDQEQEEVTNAREPPPKKSMGGKAPYVMLMTAKMSEMVREGKATAEQIGNMAMLSPCIEWGTGRLVKKRSKKSMSSADISKHLGVSERTWQRYFDKFKEAGLMSRGGDSYYISTDLFKKGGEKNVKIQSSESKEEE